MTYKLFPVLLAVILLASCGNAAPSTPPATTSTPPVASDNFSRDTAGLPVATLPTELHPAENETVTLTAAPVAAQLFGQTIRRLAYNDSVPGPTLFVRQGQRIQLHLVNHLELPTTVHFHGVRGADTSDGVPRADSPAVPPGGETTFPLVFPDAGVFWYHPHVREDATQPLGLFGAVVVAPREADYFPPVDREVPVILSDLLVQPDGQPAPFARAGADHALSGRFGNVLLANGQPDFHLTARPHEVVRLFLVNASTARPFRLTLPAFAQPGQKNPPGSMKLVGRDLGRAEADTRVDTLVLGPAQRAIVDVWFSEANTYFLQNQPPHSVGQPLVTFTVAGQPLENTANKVFHDTRTHPTDYADVRDWLGKPPDKTLKFQLAGAAAEHMGHMQMGATAPDGVEYEDSMPGMGAMLNAANTAWQIVDTATGKVNMAIADWQLTRGSRVKIRLENPVGQTHAMSHPFHTHGQRFAVLAVDGVPEPTLAWQDTTLVPAGHTVDILLDATNPGRWMAHCHIAEHLESGMMFEFTVK